jgi:hypothetical protein
MMSAGVAERPLDGCDLLVQLPFGHKGREESYELRLVMKVALTGSEGEITARLIRQNLLAAIRGHETYPHEQRGLLKALFATQPMILLDELATGGENATEAIRLVEDAARFNGNPIDDVPTEMLLDWCRRAATERYPLAARVVTVVSGGENGAAAQWTPAARALLEEAPDRVAVLSSLVGRVRPKSWSGSMAAILSARAELIRDLYDRQNDLPLVEFAKDAYATLQRQITATREWETQHGRERDERFE